MAIKKMENTLLNVTLMLFIVSSIAAVALATVNNITKGPIADVQKKKTEKALSIVLPEFDTIERSSVIPYDGGSDSLIIYHAYMRGVLSGFAAETYSNKGFSGQIRIMVGFTPDTTIYNTAVLMHKETPGLGDKIDISKHEFAKQYIGKNPGIFDIRMKKDGGDIEAITAATITSRAFSDAVERAYITLKK